MDLNYNFNWPMLDTVAGGKSVLDIPGLEIDDEEKANLFLLSYGFDFHNDEDMKRLWYYHRRSIVLLNEKLNYPLYEIPEILVDRKKLGDIRKLLYFASPKNAASPDYQRWSCAILKCMHVFVHSENDLFSNFSQEIQSQVLSDFQRSIYHNGETNKKYLKSEKSTLPAVELIDFQYKPFKTSSSTVIKLLARPEAIAMKVFDKLGVRFVVKDVYDVFSVLRFLLENSVISFPHVMPDQSSNNLCPVALFRETLEQYKYNHTGNEDFSAFFVRHLDANKQAHEHLRKFNEQTHNEFKFIKFITRKLIRIDKDGKRMYNFFFPYEVQIMDESSYQKVTSGPSSHDSYKERQRESARNRLFSRT
ncbi:MAG: TIGR04552 family protein [Bdellovibrionaceae bacterium]|nr:TIGR04552 family protein [Pseudobdellovibrionaceae bacterium]